MKGIVLAGGAGSRLYPMTEVITKQLLPVYDKPMIFYPLSVLMLAHIRDILVISTPTDLPLFKKLLGSGKQLGINISYQMQNEPRGIADAFRVGADFIGNDPAALVLGDNIYYGGSFSALLQEAVGQIASNGGAVIFPIPVEDPKRFGVAELNDDGSVKSLEEKPANPKSNMAVTGLYFYDNNAVRYAAQLQPSARGELEITDLNKMYLQKGMLSAKILGRGFVWFDSGTPRSLFEAAQFVSLMEMHRKFKIACVEEIAFNQGWIDASQLEKLANSINNSYGAYLNSLL